MTVYILPYLNYNEDVFGSTCVFDTLRVGFPTAEVYVYDNSPVHTPLIKKLAENAGCTYSKLSQPIHHHEFIEHSVKYSKADKIVFLDPDVIFYDNVESKLEAIEKPLAGLLIPTHFSELFNAITVGRLHTSLMFVNREIVNSYISSFSFYDAFRPYIIKRSCKSDLFYDTCANLYQGLNKETHFFDETILDCYTHLFLGSQLNLVTPYLKGGILMREHHHMAKKDPLSVKGLWSEQKQYFLNLVPNETTQ